jgi:hypothetical protein
LDWSTPCARSLEAIAGQPFDALLPIDPKGEGLTVEDVRADEAPAGLVAELEGADVRLSGTISEPGTYDFGLVLENDSQCAPWAVYEVTLLVAAP